MVPARITNARNQFKVFIKLPILTAYAYIMPSQVICRDWKIILFCNINSILNYLIYK